MSTVKISVIPVISRRKWRRVLCVGLLLFAGQCLALTLEAQTPEPADTIKIESDLVNLNVSVFNRKPGQKNPPLQQNDFIIYENGVRQEISFFASADSPFDLVLLLDLSGSTTNKIGLIKKSAKRFVDAARPADRIAVVTFTAEIQVVSTLTSDHEALKRNIDHMQKPQGGTNFWDALRFVLEHVLGQSRADRRRTAVVVMTDGVDNALPDVFGEGSQTSFEQLLDIVRQADVIILPIYLDTENEANPNTMPHSAYALARKQLALLAEESGNTVYQARQIKDLQGVYEQVIQDLSTVYSIGYRPQNRERDGAWRAVKIELAEHPELFVRSKRGYYAK